MKAVLFAAGKSTRTHPLTLTRPKPLLPVANRTIIEHQLDALEGLVDAAVLVVGYLGKMIQERFGDTYGSLALEYVWQAEQRGTGHALLQCAERIKGPFIALNGDDIYAESDLRVLCEAGQAALVRTVEDPRLYGVYEVDDAGRVVRIEEKPHAPKSNLANMGAYKFTPEVFEILADTAPSARGEIEITSAIQALADAGKFHVVESNGHWFPIAYPWDLLDANAYFLEHSKDPVIRGEVSAAAHLDGLVSIGKGTVVRPGVIIDGPVCIGDGASIGPNCWIRAGSTIGKGCKVGQGVEIKNSILMDGAKVPHLSYVGDSVIGADANLGCGTVTANFRHDGTNHQSMVKGELVDTGRRKFGTIIGDGVHTGINTSIYPGRKIWPGASTLPGEVVKKDIET